MLHTVPIVFLPFLEMARPSSLGQSLSLSLCMCCANVFAGIVLQAPSLPSLNPLLVFPIQRAGEAGQTKPHTFPPVTGAVLVNVIVL